MRTELINCLTPSLFKIFGSATVCRYQKSLSLLRNLPGNSADKLRHPRSDAYSADKSLFSSVQSNTLHLLYPLLPAKSSQPYNLQPRRQNFILCAITSTSTHSLTHSDKCNFITCMLFHNAY